MKNVNYWTWKDSEVIAQLEQYGVVLDHYDRKEAINQLKIEEAKAGLIKMAVENEDGTVDTEEEMIEKKPEMQTMKVIFHRTSDIDAPYVFIGLNGVCFYIRRDEEITIPKYLIDSVIKDAVEDRLMPVTAPGGDINWVTRKVQKYPFSLV